MTFSIKAWHYSTLIIDKEIVADTITEAQYYKNGILAASKATGVTIKKIEQ